MPANGLHLVDHEQSNAESTAWPTPTPTGLYNRRYWGHELERHVELYKR